MDKVIRRTVLAKRQAARSLARRQRQAAVDDKLELKYNQSQIAKDSGNLLRAARKARREDWELGALAPRRDVGDFAKTFGAVDSRHVSGAKAAPHERSKFWNIIVGDRVVILEGVDKGKIGTIKETLRDSNKVYVKDLNLIEVESPSFINEDGSQPVVRTEKALPLDAVRLVHPVTNRETGKTTDVIVRKLSTSKIWFDPVTKAPRWTRFAQGTNIAIPWPKKEPEEASDTPADTLRIDVEQRSFVPTLLRPPMPASVIDELRNKYSKFRDRHDEEYIAKKEHEAEEERKRVEIGQLMMQTPLQQYHKQKQREREALGPPELSRENMARIGEVMARNQGITFEEQR